MSADTVVVVNPSSRSGETGRRLGELERSLQRHLGAVQLRCTERSGDGERLALEAAGQGAQRVIVAGGDGTVSEVVTGLVRSGRASEIELGLLPLGTGRDFARLLRLGTDVEASIARLATGRRRVVDAGRLRCRTKTGGERERCFLNIASLGLSGESVLWLEERGKRGQRGPLSYALSAVVGLARYHIPEVTVQLDERVVHSGPLLLLAAANGQYFAGGMRVAPAASIDDAQFDVVVVEGMSKFAALLRLPRLLNGSHTQSPGIHVHHGRALRVESAGQVWVEADGEPLGTLPATIELLPAAITLCGLP